MIYKYINITVSIIALSIILLVTFKYCGKKTFTQADIDAINLADSLKKQDLIDSLNFVSGQLSLQQERATAQQERVTDLENKIDSFTAKHATTKQSLKQYPSDTTFTLAPNEYINECEGCFTLLGKYKKENIQLKFERDNFDTLMRRQSNIQEQQIKEIDDEASRYLKLLNDCIRNHSYADTTRKVKISLMGMLGNPFLPKGGGAGLIYEDKKFNEFGGHFLLTNNGPVYMINIAKKISFRRKK